MNTIICALESALFDKKPIIITLFILGFYYIFFMLCFDIMDILADIYDAIKYSMIKYIKKIWNKCGRALFLALWLNVRSFDKYKKFYNEVDDENEIKKL